MESPLKVSVIVPVYNTARYLAACIEGLLDQDFDPSAYEILAVDNNSTDESASIIERYPRVRLLHEPKQGSYAARNRGVREAKGEIIAFTDSDCVPERDWLREGLAGLDASGVEIVVGHTYFDPRSWWMHQLGRFERAKGRYALSSDDPGVYYGHTNNLITRRDTLEIAGGFAEWMRGSDVILVQQTVRRATCDSVVYRPSMRVRHLEVADLLAYYRKLFTYGRSQRRYRKVVPARPLNALERLRVFRDISGELSWRGEIALFAVLCAGLVPWSAGVLAAMATSSSGQPASRAHPTSCCGAPEA